MDRSAASPASFTGTAAKRLLRKHWPGKAIPQSAQQLIITRPMSIHTGHQACASWARSARTAFTAGRARLERQAPLRSATRAENRSRHRNRANILLRSARPLMRRPLTLWRWNALMNKDFAKRRPKLPNPKRRQPSPPITRVVMTALPRLSTSASRALTKHQTIATKPRPKVATALSQDKSFRASVRSNRSSATAERGKRSPAASQPSKLPLVSPATKPRFSLPLPLIPA